MTNASRLAFAILSPFLLLVAIIAVLPPIVVGVYYLMRLSFSLWGIIQ